MLSPALALSLLACATAHAPGAGQRPADLPPWGAALFAKVDAMEGEISAMKTTVATQNDMLKMQGETIAGISARIQELETHPPQASSGQNVQTDPGNGNATRRGMQQEPKDPCRNPAQVSARSQSVMRACCPRGKGGHRRLQARCKKLPGTCGTMQCAAAFVGFFDDCSSVLNKGEFRRFYAGCKELQAQSKRMLLQPVSVQMFKVAIATKPPPSAVSPGPPPPSKPHSSPPPPPHASAVQEYHAVCSSATIETCVPTCNATHHGYVLLATIDGTDTKFSCNVAHGLYSWVGAASEGGYLGVDFQAFFSAVSSGAAGNYLVTMIAAAGISTALTIRAGQIVSINGGGSGKGERKFTTAAAAAAAPPPRSLLRRHPYNNSNNNIRHTGHT